MFSESERVASGQPLAQGDVLEAREARDVWNHHLLVVTADCDLAHAKHHGRITCVPFLSVDDYLTILHLPRLQEKIVQRHIRELQDVVQKENKTAPTGPRLEEWILEIEDADSVVDQLGLAAARARNRAVASVNGILAAYGETQDANGMLRNMVASQRLFDSPKDEAKLLLEARAFVRQAFVQPPGDSLFLNSISPGYSDGYFAYLRHIEQVWEPDVALTGVSSGAPFRRIGRMKDRFAHALVQRFALVYMPIGLPDEYEGARNDHAQLLEGSLV